ncbi:MFS transporter [Solibacillus sp. R5-41]|uniref:MFS transporter n=1 Tax=Solibacillus sp. R5-41 TaxID=2048654 RepID=UPI000C1269E0|nr:MFS transporter [Solibacillus sp. R5-41]ATP41118.1 MFS transporter [Solibacillus sp. R5-41]
MSHEKEKLWTKNFITVALINFIIIVIFYLLMVTIAAYAVNEFNATTAQAGLVSGIYIVGALFGRLITGRIIQSVGSKKILLIGLALFVLTLLLYFIPAGITVLMGIRLLNGIAVGVASTATGTIIAQILPIERKGEGIGYYSMSSTLGTAIGPLIGLLLIQHTTYFVIFAMCVALAGISLFAALTTNMPLIAKLTAPAQKGFHISQFIDLKALPIGILIMLFALGYSGILSFINFFAEERDVVSASSMFFLVYAISLLLTRPFTGRLMDEKGANIVMYPGIILFAIGLVLLSTTQSSFTLLLAGAIIGIGYGNVASSFQALAIKVTSPEKMGLATSTYFIGLDIGLGFGPYFLGYLEPIFGYGKLYFALGIFIFFFVFLYYFLHGRKDHLLAQ